MALMSSLRSNSFKASSSKAPQHRYDVFLSFRGKDVRDTFVAHLSRALYEKGIETFKDDAKLEHGKRIDDDLFEAIEESRFSIVVLSKNYADSSWCLRELVRILKVNRDRGQDLQKHVYPIFFKVSPSDVRKQKGAFGEGFAKACLKKEEDEVKRWRDALEEVGNLKGWDYPNAKFENEPSLIDDIVHKIFNISNDRCRTPDEDHVGIGSRMMKVINLLDLGSDKARAVGLWGMGGIGKTTLAKAVYDDISCKFEGCSFIDNVREVFESRGVLPLQQRLIWDILKEEKQSVVSGIRIIQDRICRKKVLIVLDDVNSIKQVEDLVGKLQWFGRGSRIIITSRDKQVLDVCGVQDVFNVQKLDKDEAMQLFKSKAFAESGETGEYHRQIDRALRYADGVPLALKVLGSTLFGGNVPKWEDLLDRLGDSLDDELQKVLKISYDGLTWKDQQIFLDICCFFKGRSKDQVVKVLDSCDFNPDFGIQDLVQKSLLTISGDGELMMHDLVQKMGWSIVDEESRREPGERSRLWRPDDVKRVLMEKLGTKKVEGIRYRNPENLQPDAFAKMSNLRILAITPSAQSAIDIPSKLRHLQWVSRFFGSIYLPNKLRLLCWDGYPLKYMPSTFQPELLVELNLVNSRIKRLWDRTMVLPKLRVINLSGSKSLTKSPDFTGFPNLEYLELNGCTSLVDIDPSIEDLKKLKHLNLKGCSRLETLPDGIKSQCFKIMIFSGCSKLDNILERFRDLKQLQLLDLDGTGIKELPETIGNSTDLVYLSCKDCEKLKSIPGSIGKLKKLEHLLLNGCFSLSKLPEEVGDIDSLLTLDVIYSGITQLPASTVWLRNLEELRFGTYLSTSQILNSTLLDFSEFLYLKRLYLILFGLTSFIESISLCFSLEYLCLSGDFESLPVDIKDLRNLKMLWLWDCKRLQELPDLPPNVPNVYIVGCVSLRTICSPTVLRDAQDLTFLSCPKLGGSEEINVLLGFKFLYDQIKENDHCTIRQYAGPGSKIPKWIKYQNGGGSLALRLSIEDLNTSKLLGFALSAVVATDYQICNIFVTMRIAGKVLHRIPLCPFYLYSEDVVILFYPIERLNIILTHTSGNVMEVCFSTLGTDDRLKPASEVKACGAHLIYR